MSADFSALLKEARQAAGNAYAPYSHIKRGAALLADDGAIYAAANVEFATYSGSICAEMAALAKAVSHGKRKFVALALTPYGFPCGSCRQALSEFGLHLQIVSAEGESAAKVILLSELLPNSFGKAQLG